MKTDKNATAPARGNEYAERACSFLRRRGFDAQIVAKIGQHKCDALVAGSPVEIKGSANHKINQTASGFGFAISRISSRQRITAPVVILYCDCDPECVFIIPTNAIENHFIAIPCPADSHPTTYSGKWSIYYNDLALLKKIVARYTTPIDDLPIFKQGN